MHELIGGEGSQGDGQTHRGGHQSAQTHPELLPPQPGRHCPYPSVGWRNTYPTPRTVWMSRGSPPASVFRRRYPMYTSSEFELAPKS